MSASFDILSKLPFPGLRSYEPSEQEIFYGRDRQLDELLRKIRSNRFLAVVGNAGSGKSSLVKASLVPKLEDGFAGQAGQNWRIAICNPGNNPIGNLSRQLAQQNVLHGDDKMDPNYPAVIEKTLRRGSLGIVEAYKAADVERENLMIIVDQFEEIFAFSKKNQNNQEDAATFVNLLLNASRQRDVPIYIVLTMRSSFIGSCTEFRGLPEAINDGQFLIPRMKTEEFRKVIISPIKATGATIEPELVSRMMIDMGDDFDDLPILQHCMMRTWDNWVETDVDPNVPIGLKHYENVGGIKKALSIHAEEAFQGLKTREKQIIAERMFRALSEKGSDGEAEKRAVTVREIMYITGAPLTSVVEVIDTFSRPGRLFLNAPAKSDIEEDTTINIAHESLISRWDRLDKWATEEYESADMYVRMSAAAQLYLNSQGGLWADPELSLGLKWYDPERYDLENPDRLAPNKAWSERYNEMFMDTVDFLKKSEEAQNKVASDRKEDDDRKKRSRMLIMYLSLGFGVICLILLLLAGVALDSSRRSALLAGQKEKAARLAAYQAEMAKQAAAENEFKAKTSAMRAEEQRLLADLAKQKAIFASNYAQDAMLDARNSEKKALLAFNDAEDKRKQAEAAKLQAEKDRQAAVESEKLAQEERLKAIREKGLSLAQSVAVKSWKVEDPDIQMLLAKEAFELNSVNSGKDNDPYIYEAVYRAMDKMQEVNDNPDFNTLSTPPEGLEHIGAVRALVVAKGEAAKDQKLYTTGSDGWLFEWNLQTFETKEQRAEKGKPEVLVRNRNNRVFRCMDMNEEGNLLARAGDEDFIELFDVKAKERVLKIDAHRGRRVWALEFLPNGSAIVSAGDDGTIKYSNLKGEVTPIVEDLPYRVTSISVSGDGAHVAGAGGESYVSIWNIKTQQEEFKLENPYNKAKATAVAISPAGRFVAVGYQDGGLVVYDMAHYVSGLDEDGEPYRPVRMRNHSTTISDIAFSDDGTQMVVGSFDQKASLYRIWDKDAEIKTYKAEYPFADTKFEPIILDDHEDWVLSVAFTHDGQKVLTGCHDGATKIYETNMFEYSDQMCEMLRKNMSNKTWKKYVGTDDPERDPRQQKLYIITPDGDRRPINTCGAEYPQAE
jgi:WD40 repeat protein